MGVLLTRILKREQTSLKALSGKSFAIDGNIELHQFLAIIRKPDGALFTDNTGRVTSHLIGLLTRTSTLMTDYKMRPVFVFDGRPNPLKRRVIEARREARQRAEAEYAEAVSKRDYSTAWSKAVMTGRVTGEVLQDAKRLLSLMGIPWLEAREDAEAQASQMAARGDVWAVGRRTMTLSYLEPPSSPDTSRLPVRSTCRPRGECDRSSLSLSSSLRTLSCST